MRRRLPGVTAAPTTAAFATGDGPGLTAEATTAALATGAPTTPTRPTRAALSGMSRSSRFERFVSLERGDDRLDGNAAVGDELTAGAPCGRSERRSPGVLVHEHARDAARIHRVRQVFDIVRREQLGQLRFEFDERSEIARIRQLERVDSPIVVLGQDDGVDHADCARFDQLQQLLDDFAAEALLPFGELDDKVVNRPQLRQFVFTTKLRPLTYDE